MVDEFTSNFMEKRIKHLKIGSRYYLLSDELSAVKNGIKAEPESAGIFLGEERKKSFFPSIALLDMIAKETDRKVTIEGKAEWMFICGREAFRKSIISSIPKRGEMSIVLNTKGEVLGLGKMTDTGIKAMIDRGDFLRREGKRIQ